MLAEVALPVLVDDVQAEDVEATRGRVPVPMHGTGPTNEPQPGCSSVIIRPCMTPRSRAAGAGRRAATEAAGIQVRHVAGVGEHEAAAVAARAGLVRDGVLLSAFAPALNVKPRKCDLVSGRVGAEIEDHRQRIARRRVVKDVHSWRSTEDCREGLIHLRARSAH